MGEQEKQWTIFLSYSKADRPFADRLYQKLHDTGITVWYDEMEISIGDSIPLKIGEGLSRSVFLLVVLSEAAMESNWVITELTPKILHRVESQKVTILPIVLGNIDPERLANYLERTLLAGIKWLEFPQGEFSEAFDNAFNQLQQGIERQIHVRKLPARVGVTGTLLKVQGLENPFSLHRYGIEPEKFFVDAPAVKEVTKMIAEGLWLSIVGAPMMGKTSLLNFIGSPLYRDYYRDAIGSSSEIRVGYLDLQDYQDKSCNELIPELAKVMSSFLSASSRFNDSTHDPINWIRSTAGRRHAKHPLYILLIDEFDLIVKMKEINETFFINLGSLFKNNLCLVVASRQILRNFLALQNIGTPKLGMFTPCTLALWPEDTVRTFMFEPHGERLQQFDDNDFAFMVQLTACHPYLLQVGCKILLDDRLSGKKRKAEDEELLTKYLEYTEDLYWSYWNNLIDDKERGWLRDCFWVLSLEDKKTYLKELQTDTLHRKNAAIYKRLVSLGLVVSKEDSLEIPRGFAAFYETNLAENR